MRAGAKVVYTYDVYWELSDVSWASRWDAYLRMPGGRVHWFSILNSLMVVLVMSSIVAMILMRTVRRDLARYEGILGDGGARLPAAAPPTGSPATCDPAAVLLIRQVGPYGVWESCTKGSAQHCGKLQETARRTYAMLCRSVACLSPCRCTR